MIYGYARVSSKGQERYGNGLDVQIEQLRNNGVEKIYAESYTGTKKHRPELDRLLSDVCEGDTVIVTKLDRIARSVRDGIDIIDELSARGVKINILNMGVFDNSPNGKLMRTIFLAFAEFERDMIVTRTTEGKEIKRANGTLKEGRSRIDTVDFDRLYKEYVENMKSIKECCEELGISRRTWYNRVAEIKTA